MYIQTTLPCLKMHLGAATSLCPTRCMCGSMRILLAPAPRHCRFQDSLACITAWLVPAETKESQSWTKSLHSHSCICFSPPNPELSHFLDLVEMAVFNRLLLLCVTQEAALMPVLTRADRCTPSQVHSLWWMETLPSLPLENPACDSQWGKSAGQGKSAGWGNSTDLILPNEASHFQSHKDSSVVFPFLFQLYYT